MTGESSSGEQKIKLGISTCLLGEPVRFDGGHKRDRFLTDTLSRYVEWCPVCPEVDCGLPVPRESMHLEGHPETPRLLTTRTHVDHTERMVNWARKRLKELEEENLCGFVFKSNSPSSGMERVRIYDSKGVPKKIGVGVFAKAFVEHFPLLPVEEEGRLHDLWLRENFIERVFCLKRYRDSLQEDGSVGGLVNFHTGHKLLFMAHSPQLYREMGKLVAHAKEQKREELFARYEQLMLRVLKARATPKKNANVLMHMMGFLKKRLSAEEKQEMLEIIEQYRRELIPLVVPITLMQHYVRKYKEGYLARQYYLNPHPIELQLRNHP